MDYTLIKAEEQADCDSFPSTREPLWKFAEQTPSSQTRLKTATTQAQPVTSTPVKPADPQKQVPKPAPAYFHPAAPPPPGGLDACLQNL